MRACDAARSGWLMRTTIDHLPDWKQRELREVVRIILDRFEEAHTRQATQWKKKGRIHKIILYGSHARGDWVYEPHTAKGYCSDYDLMIVVNHKQVADHGDFWHGLRDEFNRMRAARHLKTPVGMIVHTRQDLHQSLTQGRYFFVDVAREGVMLYQDDDKPLPKPRPQTPQSQLAMAREYFSEWYVTAGEFFDNFEFNLTKGRANNGAFQLHQCVEHLYHTLLLTKTLYTPHVHNIRYLRDEAGKIDRRLVHVWIEDQHWQRAAFNLLREAYVKARYSKRYAISAEQLRWLGEQAQELARVVETVCREHIADLEAAAAATSGGQSSPSTGATAPTKVAE
ncbi:nucleotidyltransferase and HEPN domain-containing protein [Sphingomonas sp. SORGH_AS_0950]|uniref:nucleotidyltransferase and HEPN domain-containing protein n=1 Tax=Sphingomonas sp. SORGH_AS_0950 TaxID=3041792 RepID=UPI0027D91420|nr:nucleotidyltransferase and HEPN domain-containing protein [Sphingomonas sp. SORGH_AS_0950]